MALNARVFFTVSQSSPVDPTPQQARQWLIEELSRPQYQAAKPTWFDQLSSAVVAWFQSLGFSASGASQAPILILVSALILAAIVGAYFIFGPPRRGRRSAISGALFGQDDARDAATIRRSAELAAGQGQWNLAIEEMFRCIARSLSERTILSVSPGTTAHDFAKRAAVVMPQFGDRLAAAASAFDDVRYLEREGTEAAYRATADLDRHLGAARPTLTGAAS